MQPTVDVHAHAVLPEAEALITAVGADGVLLGSDHHHFAMGTEDPVAALRAAPCPTPTSTPCAAATPPRRSTSPEEEPPR